MGIIRRIIDALKRGFGRGVERTVENKVYEKVTKKSTDALNQQTTEFNAASKNFEEAGSNVVMQNQANIAAASAMAGAGMAASADALKSMKFCGKCKQPCDINATACPVCGSTEFKSIAQIAEEEK